MFNYYSTQYQSLSGSYISTWRQSICFFVFALINVRFLLSLFEINTLYLTLAVFLLLFFSLNYRRIKLDFFVVNVFLFLSVLNFDAFGPYLLFLFVYTISEAGYTIRRFCFINQVFTLIVFSLVFFYLCIGILENSVWETLLTGTLSYDLGFGNPNTLSSISFFCLINGYVLSKKKFFYLLLFFIPLSLLVFFITRSRTFLIGEILLLFSHVFFFVGRFKRVKWGLIIMPLLLFFLLLYYSFNVDTDLNLLFSNRFSFLNSLLSELTLKDFLIGAKLPEEITLDNSYLFMLLKGGVFFVLIFMFLYSFSLGKYYRRNYEYLPVLIPIVFCAFTESILVGFATTNNALFWFILYKNAKK